MTEETLVEKVKIYEAKWSRYCEEDHVHDHSDGYYGTREDAKQALKKIKTKERGFHSMQIVPFEVIKVGQKYYLPVIEYPKEALSLSAKAFRELVGMRFDLALCSNMKEFLGPNEDELNKLPIPDEPSALENLTTGYTHLDLGNEQITVLRTRPLEVK